MPVKQKPKVNDKEPSKIRRIIHILLGNDKQRPVQKVLEMNDFPEPQSARGNAVSDIYSFDIAHRFFSTSNIGGVMQESFPMEDKKEAIRVYVTPKSVVGELEGKPKLLDLEGIDEKIAVITDKKDLVVQYHARNELEALIKCLENRKQYKEKGAFFSQFDTTTMEKVEAVTKKHKLVMRGVDIFIPEFPKDAVAVMKEYTKHYEEITGKKPRFNVIATEEDFRDKDGKRDPILLAQSPFGFYFDILGAWDKEMILLSEL